MKPAENLFSWPVTVYYEDTDAAGVVYYANYLKYLERARTEWLRALGFVQSELATDTGQRFAVAELTISFLAPARLDDRLLVGVALTEAGRVTLSMAQTIHRSGRETPLVRAQVRIACLDAGFKPARMPQPLLARVRSALAEKGTPT